MLRHYFYLAAAAAGLVLGPYSATAQEPAESLKTRWANTVNSQKVLPEYPRPQMTRLQWLNLNGPWQMAFAKAGDQPPLGKELKERILVPFPVESSLSGVGKTTDRLWYRRTFSIPADWQGQRVLLHFGAVDWEATIWVNGKKIGVHQGGYDAFNFDITEALKKTGSQEVVVGVFDPTDAGTQPRGKQVRNPKGIFYTSTTGIWQTVWLEPVPTASIAGLKIVPDVDGGVLRVTVQGRGTTAKQQASITVREGARTLKAVSGPVGSPIEIPIPQAKLWSPDSPFLYDLTVALKEGDKFLDRVRSYAGMRKISIGPDEKGVVRLLLNGKPLFMTGPLDQGFWPDGLYTAPTDEALKFDIEMTKQLGFNMTRKHVKVEPARWYHWCDKLGLLVWQDMPSGDASVAVGKGEIKRTPESAKQFELELKAMIDGLHHHPSIVMWVVFNEGWGQYDTQRLAAWTKEYDRTRLVNSASGWNDFKVGDVFDIHKYPGPASPPPEPKRAVILGEFGGLGLPIKDHLWAKESWGYQGVKSNRELMTRYEEMQREVQRLKDESGLSAAIYTQLTDVETEANGLLTYDRAVVKVEANRLAAVNRGDFSQIPDAAFGVPTSEKEGQTWRYTLDKPADDWMQPDFDDSKWKQGTGFFGQGRGQPGTEWKTNNIWLRQEFTITGGIPDDLVARVWIDDDANIYINGVLALRVPRWMNQYENRPIKPEALAALKPGKNVLAVYCHQGTGPQHVDVGIIRAEKP